MKVTDELKELATELVAACDQAAKLVTHPDPGNPGHFITRCDTTKSSRAAAKGRLLIYKLGVFGSIWAGPFDANDFTVTTNVEKMSGTAQEILEAIEKGRLSSIEEKVSAAVLGDLVEHAEILIEQKFHLAAAVVLRAVLEERLRKLCEAHTLPITAPKPTMDHFRQALAKADVIDKVVAKKIDWMAGVGNAAAHNLPSFNPADVPGLYKDTLDFLDRFAV